MSAAPLHERLAGLSDKDLATLAENARRLKASNNAVQRQAAEDLWPHLETELAARPPMRGTKAKSSRR